MAADSVGEAGKKLLQKLADFCNLVLSGVVPDGCRSSFFGATLCALKKPSGGLRPIAVGNTLRRLVDKSLCAIMKDNVATIVQPNQLGCGTPLGAELAVHATRRFVDQQGDRSGQVLLKVDFRNAFNALRRDKFLSEVLQKLPLAYRHAWQAYSSPSDLRLGDHVIKSSEGVQQGDPLGPVYFSVGIQPLVNGCKSSLNIWYLDDGSVGGDQTVVLDDFKSILAASEQYGLSVNDAKCELAFMRDDDPDRDEITERFRQLAPGIKVLPKDTLTLLGAPILDASVDVVLAQKIADLIRLGNRLTILDPHDALFLLRHCFSLPKLLYVLRAAPCFQSDCLDQYDNVIRTTLEAVLNNTLNDRAWQQASLPVDLGGLGIRSAKDLSLPAHLSSLHATDGSVSTLSPGSVDEAVAAKTVGISLWKERSDQLAVPSSAAFQKSWDKPICKKKFDQLLATAGDERDKARLLAVSSSHASDWLNALPVPSLGLKMPGNQLRVATALRLGVKACEPHQCAACGTSVDQSGTHGLSCQKSRGRFARHVLVNDLIKRALVSANVPATLEPTGLCPGDERRPDGLTLVPWEGGRPAVWDFTCSDTLAPSLVSRSALAAGNVALDKERMKAAKYADLSSTYHVTPVCIETFGAWGPTATKFVSSVGKRIRDATGESRASSFLFQRIGMAVQLGNAASVLGSLPEGRGLSEVLYV
jgi:hypothetical protein